ncbi:MAG: type III pantothenate kinase [Lachnospiraceae bacterium]|nr:type III pantothenate kinase [Lachnospiraceae bacterium]
MVLVIDVGNTNITCGVFAADTEGGEAKCTFRLMTQTPRTSDEYGLEILSLLKLNGLNKGDLTGVIIASVVPKVMHALVNGIIKYIGHHPYIVGPGIKTGIRIATDNPREVGPDRIVDAVAAYTIYGGPVLVIDFGTATTYDLVDDTGSFGVGITAPGMRISAKALWEDTAKLPEIEIRKPDSILARETVSSMQAGLVYGQIGQTSYIIERVREESGFKNMRVVATGGLGRMISEETKEIDVYDPLLTLRGLQILYRKNRRSKPAATEFEEGSPET